MLKDNVKMLDMDEHQRAMRESLISDLVAVARNYGLVVDLATSDNVMYVQDKWGGEIAI